MSDLLKHQQALHENNAKWNRAVDLIKEINIKYITQEEFRGLVDEIVKAVFSND